MKVYHRFKAQCYIIYDFECKFVSVNSVQGIILSFSPNAPVGNFAQLCVVGGEIFAEFYFSLINVSSNSCVLCS